jgi:hypothetical protein
MLQQYDRKNGTSLSLSTRGAQPSGGQNFLAMQIERKERKKNLYLEILS